MSTRYDVSMSNIAAMQAGQYGCIVAENGTVVADLGSTAPEYFYGVIKAFANATITITARPSLHGQTAITSLSLVAGQEICGKFNTFSVASGKVVAYIGKEVSVE